MQKYKVQRVKFRSCFLSAVWPFWVVYPVSASSNRGQIDCILRFQLVLWSHFSFYSYSRYLLIKTKWDCLCILFYWDSKVNTMEVWLQWMREASWLNMWLTAGSDFDCEFQTVLTRSLYRKTKLTSRIYLLFNVALMVKKTTFLARSNLKKNERLTQDEQI